MANELKEPNEPNEPKELNQTPSAEDYEALKAELEAEKQKATQLVEEATKPLQERIISLGADLATKTGELNELKELNKLAVEDFKKLVLQTNPLFTPDIIGGDTIDAVKTSVEKAGVLVSKVKEGLEAQAKALAGQTTVPAGAPARSPISTEGLSTKEKINLGLEQARRKKE